MCQAQSHSFRRPDGSVLVINTYTGDGVSVVELVEQAPVKPLQPLDSQGEGE